VNPVNPSLTAHARSRARQRALGPAELDCIQAYGTEVHDHHGGLVYHMDRRALHRAERGMGSRAFRAFEPLVKGRYVVISLRSGAVITAGHRYKPIVRDA
jgi:hypothetical protein